ncbi:1167_t:CDS:2, partial [Paraglomus occultum]
RLSLTFPRDKLFSHTPSTSIDSIQSLSPTSTTGEKELPTNGTLKSVERRQSLPSDETFILAVIGKPNVGKSTITCTGLRNLAPIKNVGVEQSILKTPSFISEIEVDDHLYPVEVMELREDVFDMRSEIEWPRDLPEIDGVLVCYDCENRDTIANIAWLLSAFREFEVPAILVATKSESPNRRVDTAHGTKLGGLFNVGFVELDATNPQSAEKIHDVFSMLLRLAIRRREFQRQRADKRQRSDSHEISISELDIIPFYKHKRTSSDVSHNNHTRKKKELGKELSRSWRSTWRHNSNNKSSCLSTKYASDDESTARVATSSLSRSLPRFIAKPPEISITPPQSPSRSPPTSAHTSPTNRISHPHRRALLPYSTLLQVKEMDEETSQKDTQSTESRMSTDSSFSIASDCSANWDCMFQMDPVDKSRRSNNNSQECALAIDELIERLTCGGEYGTHEDPFVITFFCVYRTFMRPREVLEKLIEKYENSGNAGSERGNPAQQ